MECGPEILLVVICLAPLITCHPEFRVIDMTHEHNKDSIYWPGNPKNNFTILSRGRNEKLGFWYESNYFSTAEHGGTHLDAPAHFAEGTLRQQQIPMEKLVGPGVVINVKGKASIDPDYRVDVNDLKAWESKHGRIPNGAIVLMNAGWMSRYPNKTLTFGSETPSEPATFHFPGFHEDAVDWLVKYRNIHVVGVDTPSNDYGQSKTFPVHVILGKANIPGVENVANLDQIPENGTMVYVAAFKLFDGSGGPARVFATFYETTETSSAGGLFGSIPLCILILTLLFKL